MELQLASRLEKIEAVLEAYLPEKPGAAWLETAFHGIEGVSQDALAALTGPGRDLIKRGGKRWRPLLMTLTCEGLGGGDRALPLTPLVEFPHNASLIHDDIEDNSEERRGRPAVHLLYGTDTAINSGSFLYFLPLACLGRWDAPAEKKNRVYEAWGEYMRRLHLGQAMDIHWHRNLALVPSPEDYRRMCALKTGCLARLAAVLGVIAASPAEEEQAEKAFGEAAEKLGVGFQILDDVKNLSEGVPGKKRGDDVVEGKKSLPVLLFLQRRPEQFIFAVRCFTEAAKKGSSAPEVEELISEIDASGALEEARLRGEALIRESREFFAHAGRLSGESCGLLIKLLESIS